MIPKQDETEIIVSSTAQAELTTTDQSEVVEAFEQGDDFRAIGERITAPIDSIISETAQVIEADPIMTVSDELAQMNTSMQSIYDDIIDNDGMMMKIAKSIPLLSILAKNLDEKWDEAKFNLQSMEGKIQTIFSGFDQSYNSLGTSIDMQKNFLAGIEENLGKVIAYKEFLQEKLTEFSSKVDDGKNEDEKMKYELFLRNVEYFISNLVVLIGNLEMARKRLLMRLDSAHKLSLAMSSSRPIFKTLLSTALIETSSQKALDASMTALNSMGETIDKMSSELTDKAIDASRRAEELSSKPVLSASVFIENVTKLKNHFDQIESFRAQVKIEAEAETQAFDDARGKLENIKTLTAKSHEEFVDAISE